MNQVAAVVVTYNRLELLKECIEKLLAQTSPCDVLIVDNASSDGTEVYIKNTYANNTRIHYRNTGANIGGAGGFNVGMRWAVEAGYEFVWVMDDDCMPSEDALSEFLKFEQINHGKYGFLASKVLWGNGKICKMNIPRETMYKNVKKINSKYTKITMASFVSLFVPSQIISIIGLPIKEFFIWSDDWEFTRRISMNYKCFLVNSSLVIHKSINNIGANIAISSVDRLNRFYFLYRNDVYLYRREGLAGLAYELLRLLFHIMQICIHSKNCRLKRIGYLIIGTYDGIFFTPKIEKI